MCIFEYNKSSLMVITMFTHRFKDGDGLATKNLYRWVPRKESKKDGKKNKESEIPWSNTIAEEEHMKRVTQVTANNQTLLS